MQNIYIWTLFCHIWTKNLYFMKIWVVAEDFACRDWTMCTKFQPFLPCTASNLMSGAQNELILVKKCSLVQYDL